MNQRSDLRFLGAGIVIGAFAFSAGAWLLARQDADDRALYRRAQTLDQVIRNVAQLYVDSLTAADLYDLAIDGLLETIDDPYAGFLEGDDFERHAELTSGTYAGIGVRVESSDGWITVVTSIAGSPAAEAGIMAGDRIVTVDGQPARGWTPDESVNALRGETGSTVELSVARPGLRELLPFTLERGEISINSVRHAQMMDDEVGYVWLEIVSARSEEELTAAVDSLRDIGATKLVLDLRGNPGGLLTESISITDLFVEDRDAVVETRTRMTSTARTYRARREQRWAEMPVVVLVNEYSASAAEIIAGALQDHDRALIVGEPTFGKGLVQSVFPLAGDRALKFTTGRWYTPLGRSIQRDGIAEDDTTDYTVVTSSGRRISGGGGVQPDVVYEPGDASPRLRLSQILGQRVQGYRDALASLARDETVEPSGTDRGPQFPSDIRGALRNRDITFTSREWAVVSDEIQRDYRYLRARFGEGEASEFALRLADDEMLRIALDRLETSATTAELLDLPGH